MLINGVFASERAIANFYAHGLPKHRRAGE